MEQPAPDRDRIAIVAAERASSSLKLVAIDEHGDRQFDLLAAPAIVARDMSPAISPDGAWLVFASTRDRGPDQTSLWIARLGVESAPTRLTDDATAIDTHPVWTRDGKAIVFASTRDGGDFDLYRLALAAGRAVGAPVALTTGAHHEVTPATARDGAIVYAAVDRTTAASHLEERLPDGTVRALTPGPDERDPAISPDGSTIVFTSAVDRGGRKDAELWTMPRGSKEAKQLVDLPPTDESGAVWSPDGRYIFATSVLPGDGNRPLFASIVFVDREETPPRVRMLRDSVGALPRLTPAIVTRALDGAALRGDPEYLPELANIMAAAIANQKTEPRP